MNRTTRVVTVTFEGTDDAFDLFWPPTPHLTTTERLAAFMLLHIDDMEAGPTGATLNRAAGAGITWTVGPMP